MLGVTKVGDRYNYKNTTSKNNSSKVSFGDLSRLGSFETEEFVRNFLEHQAGREAIVERLGHAKKFLPQVSDKPVSSADKAIHFFVNLYETLVQNPKMRVEDAVGDGLNLEAVDRMFISQPFKMVFSALKNDNKYSKFADELSKGLYDDTPEPVKAVAEITQQIETKAAKQTAETTTAPKKKSIWESKGYVSMVKETKKADETKVVPAEQENKALIAKQKVEALLKSLKEEKTTYEKKASGIETKLGELEVKKANLATEMRQANKTAHRKQMIEQFLNPESFNQKEIAQAEKMVTLSPEKQEELAALQKDFKDRRVVNNILRKNKDSESESFNQNLQKLSELKIKIQELENSKTMTAEALKKKELLLVQRQMVIDFNNKTVAELANDTRSWTQAMLKSLGSGKEIIEKDKITGKDLLQMKLKELSAQEKKAAKITKKRKQLEEFLDINTYNRAKQVFIEGQFEFNPSEHNKLVHAVTELYAAEKLAKNKNISPEIKAKHEEKVQQLTKKVEELRISEFATPALLKKRDEILAQRQAVIDFNKKTVAKLKEDERPFIQTMLKAVATKKEIDPNKTTGRDLLNLKIAELKAEEEKLVSPQNKLKAINLDILGFGEEHKAYINNIEQLERKIEDIEFEQSKVERGIEETVEMPVVLPKKKKNPTNIDKQKRHMSTEEKRAASLARKAKRKELKAEIDKKIEEKIATNNAKIQEMSEELQFLEKEIADKETTIAAYRTDIALKNRESKFHNAEKARKSNLGVLKSLANEVVTVPTTSSVQAVDIKPVRGDFSSEKEFKNAVKKFIRTQNRIKTKNERATKSGNKSNIRIKRNEIAESANELPSIKILAKAIEKVKKFLSAESFNQKELSLVELNVLPEKKLALQEAKAKLDALKQENEILKPFTGYVKQEKGKTIFVKFDYDAQIAAWIKKEPKEHEFTITKSFNKSLESWQARKTELKEQKVKGNTFYKNEKEIKQYEELILQLESEQTLTPKAIKLREILLKQRKSVADFNNTKLKDIEHNPLKNSIIGDLPSEYRQFVNPEVMTGRNLLNLRLGELEAKKEALIESEKETWYLSTLASKLTSDKDLLKTQKKILEGHIKEIENENLSIIKQTESMKKKVKV